VAGVVIVQQLRQHIGESAAVVVNQMIRIARFSRQKSRDAFGMPPDAENTSGWTRLNCGALNHYQSTFSH